MDRISINLLPLNLKENKHLLYKKKLVSAASIGFLGLLVVFSIVLIALSVIQNRQLESETASLAKAQLTLSSFKEKEAAVIILKKRLDSISQIMKQKYPQTDSFLLIDSLLPPETTIQSFRVDQTNIVNLQGSSETASSLQQFFDNLTDPKINEGKVIKTVISNLNRGSSPKLGFDLAISTKIDVGGK